MKDPSLISSSYTSSRFRLLDGRCASSVGDVCDRASTRG